MSNYLLFDIGGTKTRISISQDQASFGKTVIFPTPEKIEEGVEKIVETAEQLCNGKIDVAAGGIAGPLNKEKNGIVNAPNLHGWNNKNFVQSLENLLETKVYIENDTALVGLGEAVYGTGKDKRIVAYVTISTGMNGVRVVDRKIEENVFGFEIGRQIIDYKSHPVVPYFEEMVSGGGIRRQTGKDPRFIDDKDFWEEKARLLAFGLNNTIVHWSPEVVILGGGVMQHISLESVQKHLSKILTTFPSLPVLTRAELGDTGGLYGALHFLNSL